MWKGKLKMNGKARSARKVESGRPADTAANREGEHGHIAALKDLLSSHARPWESLYVELMYAMLIGGSARTVVTV